MSQVFSFDTRHRKIDARLISGAVPGARLALVLPGAGYSCQMPLLYYSIQVLLKCGFEVLAVEKVYAEDPDWMALGSQDLAFRQVGEDAVDLFPQIVARFPKGIHTLLGRSLGTFAMAYALEAGAVTAERMIWQCPSLRELWPTLQRYGDRSFAVIGTADERFVKAREFLPPDQLVVDGADHALEFAGQPQRSIEALQLMIQALESWIPR